MNPRGLWSKKLSPVWSYLSCLWSRRAALRILPVQTDSEVLSLLSPLLLIVLDHHLCPGTSGGSSSKKLSFSTWKSSLLSALSSCSSVSQSFSQDSYRWREGGVSNEYQWQGLRMWRRRPCWMTFLQKLHLFLFVKLSAAVTGWRDGSELFVLDRGTRLEDWQQVDQEIFFQSFWALWQSSCRVRHASSSRFSNVFSDVLCWRARGRRRWRWRSQAKRYASIFGTCAMTMTSVTA